MRPLRLSLLFLAASAGAACAPVEPRTAAPKAQAQRVPVERLLNLAAEQVRRCYRSPRVSFEGRQIVTRLRVRYSGDGQLAQLPVVIAQDGVNPRNRPYAGRMAEAAIEAVMRCTPLQLPRGVPPTAYFAFDLTFSPLSPA